MQWNPVSLKSGLIIELILLEKGCEVYNGRVASVESVPIHKKGQGIHWAIVLVGHLNARSLTVSINRPVIIINTFHCSK